MTTRTPLLEVDSLTVRFGGLVAVNGVSFAAGDGELLGIIGPNGAGKTTAFNAIAGAVRPTSGRISIGGKRIGGLAPERVARHGVSRTFQSVRLFSRMTVRENIALAAVAKAPRISKAYERADEVAATLSMEHLLGHEAGSLPLADQKRVEIARALATEPRVLLLDEMMSGLNDEETALIIGIIKKLNQGGLTMIVIEHVIRVILELSHRVIVLDNGNLIAEGLPNEVMKAERAESMP